MRTCVALLTCTGVGHQKQLRLHSRQVQPQWLERNWDLMVGVWIRLFLVTLEGIIITTKRAVLHSGRRSLVWTLSSKQPYRGTRVDHEEIIIPSRRVV